jgi:hypothetical protein
MNALKVTKFQNPSFLGSNGNQNASVIDGLTNSIIPPCPDILYRKVIFTLWGDLDVFGEITVKGFYNIVSFTLQ